MLEVLISGKLLRDPQTRTGQSGKPFATALVRVPTEKDESVLANVIAFGDTGERLARLKAGDPVSMAGSAKLSLWERDGQPHQGLSVTASAILSAYDAKKRRGDLQDGHRQGSGPHRGGVPFDDGLPF